ncbi:O-antigen ligase family protein [Photobacterium aphoticum]|uniref:O-antigen ligase-related domain-containing protein n=1 Tax=Photobacterium aphoticum TaxID=754436 RepID=A0A0J1JDG4_9GAMM|nr:O-antigen ligase family protein [Photobacterium aphoticum]KLU99671.1 hypothetical protein ABT58_16435 [Photobacterium aphoticum]PSU55283.1 ligase [Photobacterium aphoticum]GHA43909.1 hypothetical protein GCM10007086_16980 [Photobacterium aphoticum]
MNKKTLLNAGMLLPIIWLFSGMLLMRSGDKPMVGFAIVAIIASICAYGFNMAKSNIKNDKFLWVLLATTGYALFSYHYHGLSSRELRALLTASLFLVFFPHHLLNRYLHVLLLIGSLSSLGFAFYWGVYLGVDRGLWDINAIPQATMSAALGLLSLVSALYLSNPKRTICLLAFFLSTAAVLISQTRGIWLSYFVLIALFIIFQIRHVLTSKKGLLACVAILIAGGFSLHPIVEKRIGETQYEISQIMNGNLNTSIGLRLQMWALAPKIIDDNWLLGLGEEHKQKFNELYQQGSVSQALKHLNPAHYHNQYIDKIIKGGVVGLSLFIALLIIPLLSLTKSTYMHRYILVALVLLYAIASLTDVPFNHAQPLLLYMILVSCLMTPMENK